MINLTGHMMCLNEEYWIGYTLGALCQVLDNIIVIDCGSQDNTVQIINHIAQLYPGRIYFEAYGPMTPEENGRIRQRMTELTKTEWGAVFDADELYTPRSLTNLINSEFDHQIRLSYGLMQVVDFIDGEFVTREKFNRQILFHIPTTYWGGVFPFDVPKPWSDLPDSYFRYYHQDVPSYDLNHLPRSPLDAETRHRLRNDGIRQVTPITGVVPDLLPYLEALKLNLRLPSNPVLEAVYASRLAV